MAVLKCDRDLCLRRREEEREREREGGAWGSILDFSTVGGEFQKLVTCDITLYKVVYEGISRINKIIILLISHSHLINIDDLFID